MIGLVGRARLRMVGWSILVLGLILAVTGVVLYVSLERALISSVDVELVSASESARNELVEGGGTGDLRREGYQAGMVYLVIASDGSVASNPQQIDLGTLPQDLLKTRSDAFQSVDIGAQTTRFYAQRVDEPGRDAVVLVVGRSLEPEAILEIADTGEGIPEEHLSRVFDRFHRVDASRTRRTGGAGLGLAIARTLINAHGGDIAIATADAGGTRVTIRLPLLASEPDAIQEQAATAGR